MPAGHSNSKLRATPPYRLLLGALGFEVHSCGALQDAEGERLGQVEVNLVLVVPRVSDGQILSYAELEVATAMGEQHSAVDFWCQHHRSVEEGLNPLAGR